MNTRKAKRNIARAHGVWQKPFLHTIFMPKSMRLQRVCSIYRGLVRRARIAQKLISGVGVWYFMGAKLVPPLGAPMRPLPTPTPEINFYDTQFGPSSQTPL